MEKEKLHELIKDKINELNQTLFKIEVEVLEDGKMPQKIRDSDAGFDVFATHDFKLYPGEVVKHPLNIRLKLPKGTWAEITTKSGLGSKGQLVYAGVIDEEYRGIPHVIMANINTKKRDKDGNLIDNTDPIEFKKGEKIAQLIMNPYSDGFYLVKVQSVDINTSRGENGFGSTGST